MNKYTKPTFIIASLGVTALAGSNCSIQKDDRDMLLGFLEGEFDIDKAFMTAEGCIEVLDGIVEGYCKFTAGSNGAIQIFNS